MSSTAETPIGEDQLAEILGLVGAWNHYGYASPEPGQAPIPPLGERSAEAIRAGHGAVKAIDELLRELQSLRGQLVTELRTDEDVRAAAIDARKPADGDS